MADISASVPVAADQPFPPAVPSKVLIAEDELLIAENMAALLTDLGFCVMGPASNGAAALVMAAEHRPDLAILDIRMPMLDGLTTASRLFTEMNVPVVIVTAYSGEPEIRQAVEVGVFGYLLKPVTRQGLAAALAVAWGRYLDHFSLSAKVCDLNLALEERKQIERAKGILMQKLSLPEPEALAKLRKIARDTRRKMADVAQSVIAGQEPLG